MAENLSRKIALDLPEYFDFPEWDEYYAVGIRERTNLAIKFHGEYVGLLSLDFPYPNNSNIYWMGVLREYHGKGFGKRLIKEACSLSAKKGCSSITVETLSQTESDVHYLKTYQFYKSCGFLPLLDLKPQGYDWNMVYMVKNLRII